MNKLIEYATKSGYNVTIEKDGDYTVITVRTPSGYFKHNGIDSIQCGYYPEDERDEVADCIDRLSLGLYQYC